MATSSIRVPARLWLIILAGCVVAGVLDAGQAAMQRLFSYWGGPASGGQILFQGMEWLFLALMSPLAWTLGQRFPVRRPHVLRALAVHIPGALLLCAGWALLGVLLRRSLSEENGAFRDELGSWLLTSLPWSVFLYFALLGTVHAFTYYMESRARELQATQLAAQLSDARLGALRAQLQPHFLFNTLNAITVLVRDRREPEAVRMLDGLSDMLRQVLRSDRPHEIALRDEIQLMEQYLSIEQVRFSDRLRVDYAFDEAALHGMVPSFILQPLVENAVRHGIADRMDNARIELGARRTGDVLELWVRDNGRGPGVEEAGVGLTNTRERLAALYGERASFELARAEGGGTIARIRLPWRAA